MDDLQLGRQLGRGTFGEVFEAVRRSTGEAVAVKILNKQRIVEASAQLRLVNEVQIHSQLKHQNIVQLLECHEDSESVFLVVELCNGGELLSLVRKRGRLTESAAKLIFKQLADALLYLHGNSVMHRDIKLANILLTHNHEVKLADFGLAAALETADAERHTICGTPNYLSPELASQLPYTKATDVWSLGVVLATMLTGVPPFQESKVAATLEQVRKAKFRCPEHISSTAANLLKKMLRRDPSKRIGAEAILRHPFLNLKGELPSHILRKKRAPNDSCFSMNPHVEEKQAVLRPPPSTLLAPSKKGGSTCEESCATSSTGCSESAAVAEAAQQEAGPASGGARDSASCRVDREDSAASISGGVKASLDSSLHWDLHAGHWPGRAGSGNDECQGGAGSETAPEIRRSWLPAISGKPPLPISRTNRKGCVRRDKENLPGKIRSSSQARGIGAISQSTSLHSRALVERQEHNQPGAAPRGHFRDAGRRDRCSEHTNIFRANSLHWPRMERLQPQTHRTCHGALSLDEDGSISVQHPESGTTATVSYSGDCVKLQRAAAAESTYWWPHLPDDARRFHQSALAFARMLASSTPKTVYFGSVGHAQMMESDVLEAVCLIGSQKFAVRLDEHGNVVKVQAEGEAVNAAAAEKAVAVARRWQRKCRQAEAAAQQLPGGSVYPIVARSRDSTTPSVCSPR